MKEIITRAEAKALGLKKYFTGKPCKNGHIAERFLSGYTCLECSRDQQLRSSEYRKAYNKNYYPNWYEENKEKVLEQHKVLHEKNREYNNARCRQYYADNKERIKRHRQQYYKNNSHLFIEASIKRRRALKQQCPSWADRDKIKRIYPVSYTHLTLPTKA